MGVVRTTAGPKESTMKRQREGAGPESLDMPDAVRRAKLSEVLEKWALTWSLPDEAGNRRYTWVRICKPERDERLPDEWQARYGTRSRRDWPRLPDATTGQWRPRGGPSTADTAAAA
jgi:hypothetical protein